MWNIHQLRTYNTQHHVLYITSLSTIPLRPPWSRHASVEEEDQARGGTSHLRRARKTTTRAQQGQSVVGGQEPTQSMQIATQASQITMTGISTGTPAVERAIVVCNNPIQLTNTAPDLSAGQAGTLTATQGSISLVPDSQPGLEDGPLSTPEEEALRSEGKWGGRPWYNGVTIRCSF
ncbi:uncharacterized protein BDZ99DRAFT_504608 [Mytilinidion resinicola]|uniref:Uncharacterized protein n=1 Tax=Mytilinidion resinicola TaxID=574789 RepID=A0A6A6Y107_9PEZI|nr:uncharacterized protein BDZ99DRAFT_504608 [Mytilinidion resinicola]KAF2801497.1 hypothetical protein BDZ99DRAFT_504608 [Mytilinidion resinicola]